MGPCRLLKTIFAQFLGKYRVVSALFGKIERLTFTGTFDAFQHLVKSHSFKQICFPHRSEMGVLKSFLKDLLSAGCEKGSARSCLMLYVDSNDVKYLNRSNDLCYYDVNCSEKPTTSITQFLIKEGQLTAASKLAKFGCDHLYAESCRRYAEMCEVGQGTRKNKDLAKQFYGKACDLGDDDGCEGFARLQE